MPRCCSSGNRAKKGFPAPGAEEVLPLPPPLPPFASGSSGGGRVDCQPHSAENMWAGGGEG